MENSFIWLIGAYSRSKDIVTCENNAIDMRVGGPTYADTLRRSDSFLRPNEKQLEDMGFATYENFKKSKYMKNRQKLIDNNMTVKAKKRRKYGALYSSRIDSLASLELEFQQAKVKLHEFYKKLTDPFEMSNAIIKVFYTGHGEDFGAAGTLRGEEVGKVICSFFNCRVYANSTSRVPFRNRVELDVCVGGLHYGNNVKGETFAHKLSQQLMYGLSQFNKIDTRISYVKYPFERNVQGNRTNTRSLIKNEYMDDRYINLTNKLPKSYLYIKNGSLFNGTSTCVQSLMTEQELELEYELDMLLMHLAERFSICENIEKISSYIINKNIDELGKSLVEFLKSLEHNDHKANFIITFLKKYCNTTYEVKVKQYNAYSNPYSNPY